MEKFWKLFMLDCDEDITITEALKEVAKEFLSWIKKCITDIF